MLYHRYAEGRGYHVRAKQRLVAGSIVLEVSAPSSLVTIHSQRT